jgi:hypothetical protein
MQVLSVQGRRFCITKSNKSRMRQLWGEDSVGSAVNPSQVNCVGIATIV